MKLNELFNVTQNPTEIDINKLSMNIGINKKQIMTWFNNKRRNNKIQ